jgi:hypothetical protein
MIGIYSILLGGNKKEKGYTWDRVTWNLMLLASTEPTVSEKHRGNGNWQRLVSVSDVVFRAAHTGALKPFQMLTNRKCAAAICTETNKTENLSLV